MLRFAAVILILFFAGCVPCSENPLSAPGESGNDSALLGTWFWSEEGETGFIHIGTSRESNLLQLLMIDIKEDGKLNRSEFVGHPSLFKGKRYLNLMPLGTEADCSGYLFVKYDFEGDALVLFIMDMVVMEKAAKSGVLTGVVKDNGSSSQVRITASEKELRDFVLNHDKELFPERKVLPRLKLSPQAVKPG